MKIIKKLFLILTFLCFAVLPTYAQYRFAPDSLSKEYKAEMEKIIDKEYPKIIKDIDKQVQYAKKLHDKIMRNDYDFEDYFNLVVIPDVVIPAADIKLYLKLLRVTQEKYLKIKYEPIGTDTASIDEYLEPYIITNNVDVGKLGKIIKYENKQIEIVEKYIQEVERVVKKD